MTVTVPAARQLRNQTRRTEQPGSVVFGGYRLLAPGFSSDDFATAIKRAFDAGLQVTPGARPGQYLVINPESGTVYAATRSRCDCRAGQHAGPCKHRAMVCLIETIAIIDQPHAERSLPDG